MRFQHSHASPQYYSKSLGLVTFAQFCGNFFAFAKFRSGSILLLNQLLVMNPDPDTMVPVLCTRSYKRFLYPKAVTLKEVLSSCSLNLSANMMTPPSTLHPQNPLLGFGGGGGGVKK